MTAPRKPQASRGPFASMLRGAVLPSLAGIPAITGIAWAWSGERWALSALVGAILAFVVFAFGLVAIKIVVDGQPGFSLAGAMVVYFGQLITVVFVILLLRDLSWLDGRAFAAAVVAEGLIWQIGLIAGFLRGRHQVFDAPAVGPPQGGP